MCVVCRRRAPERGQVCERDLTAALELLNDLPRKLRLLPLMLMPGQSPAGQKVATTRIGSPTTARLDALSLVGPGAVPLPGRLRPKVRRWATQRTVQVEVTGDGGATQQRTITLDDWHAEPVVDPDTGEPVLVGDDDQVGALPPAEWLDRQAQTWRAAFGHRRRPAAYVRRGQGPRPPRDVVRWVLTHGTKQQVEAMFAVQDLQRRYRQGVTDLLVGHEPGHNGRRPASAREDDPVADAWEARFGTVGTPRGAAVNIRYLHTWLAEAAQRDDLDIAGFVAGLRAVSAELTRVLGERPDDQWLGRCPATITDRDSGDRAPCGTGLWQDPHASVVECPRCHSAWGPKPVHLVHLASDIRRVWPLDRRRRYNAEEIDALRRIRCTGCDRADITISWQEVTGLGDKLRWWRPARTRCPHGCEQGRALL